MIDQLLPALDQNYLMILTVTWSPTQFKFLQYQIDCFYIYNISIFIKYVHVGSDFFSVILY